ncbi:MAG: FAD-binding oxidoreductase [Firmicutes bacterium]|nr:FAD-binding oxidoreductase [Bacillota bacterium]
MGFFERAKAIVGPDSITNSREVCRAYGYNTFLSYKQRNLSTEMIVMPHNVQEVAEVIKLANEYKVPITPKGIAGGTGFGGPLKGGVLLDLFHMDKVLLVDPVNYKAIAEPACSFFKFSQEIFKAGMMIPTSEYTCGPNVAASAITPVNAFGKTRYGRNCDLVEGFEVVLPTGEICAVGSLAYENTYFGPFYRYIHGSDLVGLFIQSNGAFGIVTKVAYMCQKRPPYWSSCTYYWKEDEAGLCTEAMTESTALELFDIHLNDKWKYEFTTSVGSRGKLKSILPDDAYFVLHFTINAFSEDELTAKLNIIDDLCQKLKGVKLGDEVGNTFFDTWPTMHAPVIHPLNYGMWDCLYDLNRTNYHFIYDSINYPTSKFPEVYGKIREICSKYGLWGFPRPAVYDGFPMRGQVICSQTWSFINSREDEQLTNMFNCRDEFREWFGSVGGTHQQHIPPITPEYVWDNQRSDYELLRIIKKALDPNNILSPGTYSEIWGGVKQYGF